MELTIHKKLLNRVAPDQMITDPRAIVDDIWGDDDQLRRDLGKKPYEEYKSIRFDKIEKDPHPKLARTTNKDVGVIPKRRNIEKAI